MVHVYSLLRASNYGCASVQDFETANLKYFPDDVKKNTKDYWLHGVFLVYGTEIGKGGYGVVKSIKGKQESYAAKIVNPDRPSRHVDVMREIIMLKYICGVESDKDFNEFISCQGKPITPFKGCVEDNSEIYIIQRMALYSLKDQMALNIYRSLQPMYRLAVILRILDKVIELHDKGVIHSDIKPANIVSRDPYLEQIELIDLGFARIDTLSYYGGTGTFLPPEYFSNNVKKLSPQLDIYSLAITIMYLENYFTPEYHNIPSDCFKKVLTEDCHKQVLEVVTKALQQEYDFLPLKDIIFKALSFDKTKRHASVVELSKELVNAARGIRGYETYFHYLTEEEEKKAQHNPQDSLIYKWIEYAKVSGLLVKDPKFSKPKSKTPCCATKKRIVAPKMTIQKRQQIQLQLYQEQHDKLLIVQKQLKKLRENSLPILQDQEKKYQQQWQQMAKIKLQREHLQQRKDLFQEHKTKNIDQQKRKEEEKKQQEEHQKQLTDLQLTHDQQQKDLLKRHQDQKKDLQQEQPLQKLQIKDTNIYEKTINDFKGDLNQENKDQPLNNQNVIVLNPVDIDNVRIIENDIFEAEEGVPEAEFGDLPKYQNLDHYKKPSKNPGFLQNIEQQLQPEHHFMI